MVQEINYYANKNCLMCDGEIIQPQLGAPKKFCKDCLYVRILTKSRDLKRSKKIA